MLLKCINDLSAVGGCQAPNCARLRQVADERPHIDKLGNRISASDDRAVAGMGNGDLLGDEPHGYFSMLTL
jgi:hypothetical protein